MRIVAALISVACFPACLERTPYQTAGREIMEFHDAQYIAVDDQYVFAGGSGGRIVRCAKEGCDSPTVLNGGGDEIREFSLDAPQIRDLALDASHVYWTEGPVGWPFDDLPGVVMRVAKDGSRAAEKVADARAPSHLAVGGDTVYWIDRGATLRAVATGGGTPSDLATVQGSMLGLAADGRYIYWIVDNTLQRMDTDGGSIETLSRPSAPHTSDSCIGGIALDGESVLWASSEGNGRIRRTPKEGGEDAWATESCAVALAVDDHDVYWIATSSENPSGWRHGVLMRSGKSRPEPESLLGDEGVCAVASDGDYVYWSEWSTVLAMPK